MKAHPAITDRLREQVTALLMRTMPEARHREFEGHLGSCTVCSREVAFQRELATQLGFGTAPRAGRRKRGASAQPWKAWRSPRGASPLMFLPSSPEGFEPTAFPGITAKKLFVDVPNGRVTMIVRMAPGSSYPAHRHGGAEECFVIEGDLQVGSLTMRASDYQRAAPGSTHPVQSTASGCVLFLVSSLSDEIQDG
jgi:quercetin dioxygenase-like cupin family protein